MNNLHISLTNFKNESRVLKQTESILKNNIIDKVNLDSKILWKLFRTARREEIHNVKIK